MPKIREVKKQRAILTDPEIAAFLGSREVDAELKMLALLSRTIGGMRAGDLNSIQWEAFGAEFATCRVPRRKTGTPQTLDVPAEVRPFIEAWHALFGKPTAGPVFPVRHGKRAGEGKTRANQSYAKRLRRDLKRALGVSMKVDGKWKDKPTAEYTQRERELFVETDTTRPVDFHSFRRGYATALARANVNAQTAQILAGHADAATHQRYVAATTTALPVAALPPIDSGLARTLPNQLRRASKLRKQLREATQEFCAPSTIRTYDPKLRRLVLYPAELWALSGRGFTDPGVRRPETKQKKNTRTPPTGATC